MNTNSKIMVNAYLLGNKVIRVKYCIGCKKKTK